VSHLLSANIITLYMHMQIIYEDALI